MNRFSPIWNSWTVKVLFVALAYFTSGRLGLLLAVPPGYATAVWPPSGIALACVLVLGYRVWPGVLIGSFCVNIGTSLDPASTESIVRSSAMAFGIAGGASVQAVLSAWMIRKWVGYPTKLDQDSDVVKLLLIGGPSGCLVNATIGVGTLYLGGVIPISSAFHSWWTWWVGDTIGVLVFLPLAMIFMAQPRDVWRKRRLTVALPLAVTFGAAVLSFFLASARENSIIKSDFERVARRAENRLTENIDNYVSALHSIQNLYGASVNVERAEFKRFTEPILNRYPAIKALSFNRLVPDSTRIEFERNLRTEFPDFQIVEISADGKRTRAPQRKEYTVVKYLEPFAPNARALGLNVALLPDRAEALRQAATSGEPSGTGPIHLVQSKANEKGMIVFAPIYRNASSTDSKVIYGFACAAFELDHMLGAALDLGDKSDIGIDIIDIGPNGTRKAIFSSSLETGRDPNGLVSVSELGIVGRKWELRITPSQAFISSHQSMTTYFVLAGGLLFTGILGAFLLVMTGRVTAIQEIVEQRTKELAIAKASAEELSGILAMQKLALLGQNSDLQNEATTDPLTNLANRRAFNDFAGRELVRAANSMTTFALLLLDIDHFKKFNDDFGHAVGDEVLVQVARTLQGQARRNDLCARIGGEEMAIVLPGCNLENCLRVAENVRIAISEITNDHRQITASIGVVVYTAEFKNVDDMLLAADKVLYEAKAGGRNRVCAWRSEASEAA